MNKRSPEVLAFEAARARIRGICEQLEADAGSRLTDAAVLDAYADLRGRMQSNCDAVAQGLFTIVAGICAHRPHLALELLPDPLRSLYYLDIEDLEGIKRYLLWLVNYDQPYLGRATESGYRYLRELAGQDSLLIEAFRVMFSREDNGWREKDEDVPVIPAILSLGSRDAGKELKRIPDP